MTVSVSYLSKNCTTCLFISKSFKELFFITFFRKADAKVRLFFELPKLFEVFLKIIFFNRQGPNPHLSTSISLPPRFSLESGCKITALQHILQIFTTLFYHFFHIKGLSRWFSKYAVEQVFNANNPESILPYLNIYTRARI